MTDLTITLTGEVRESNFDEWKDDLVGRIRAVDIDLSADDDDFSSANDSIRQFREAERTLKAAKQAALEQAADINRLFDAVDAVTEETRQARLALERKIRVRRHELKQRSLQAQIDANSSALDALPAVHRALFQDRTTLLQLPADELEATIEQRIEVWNSAQGRGGEENALDGVDGRDGASIETAAVPGPAEPVDDASGAPVGGADGVAADTGSGELVRGWRVTIDLSADRAKAEKLFTRVRDRWRTDRAVSGIDLSAID